MFGLRKPTKRFSLVLLEEGEDYVSDWVAECKWPHAVSGNWQSLQQLRGTIRLCSKSIFFEPEDVRIPVVRLPFKAAQTLEPTNKNSFSLITTALIKMKADMADAPYIFEKGKPTTWYFSLSFAQMAEFLPIVHQYLAASRMPPADREEALQGLAEARAAAANFDTSRLVNFTETLLYDQPAVQHTPLVKEFGRLVITSERLYFQALDNVAGDTSLRSHSLTGIAAIARRRSALRPTGLELFFIEAGDKHVPSPYWDSPSVFFAFGSEAERERVVGILMSQPELASALPGGRSAAAIGASILEADKEWLQKITAAWQHGDLTNMDYLLYLNLVSRSFHDLTQYPVFPWVLADYTSKTLDLGDPKAFRDLSRPMGAMNETRLKIYQQRFWDMPREEGIGQPFMYGTHYSCPGYVMFWLVRAAPAHLLRLQNGKFDAPDRLFLSIEKSYKSATSNPADVKELIPEFYLTDSRFLTNGDQLPLGTRQNGQSVGNVELPAWAESPSDFLLKNRAALESPYVSANLHHWIDLIYGYKQKGAAAEEANNVFHHFTYEGSVDIDSIADPLQKQAAEIAVNEFGQCPKQMFDTPHPRRLVCPSTSEAMTISKAAFAEKDKLRGKVGTAGEGEPGQALSLALITLVMAATAAKERLPSNPESQKLLQGLDVSLTESKGDQRENLSEISTEPPSIAQRKAASLEHNSAKQKEEAKASSSRGWKSNIGGQISNLVGSISKEINRNDRGSSVLQTSAPQQMLKNLFQRQNTVTGTPLKTPPDYGTAEEGSAEPETMLVSQQNGPEIFVPPPDSDAMALADALGESNIATAETQARPATRQDAVGNEGLLPAGGGKVKIRLTQGHWGSGLRHRFNSPPLMISASNRPISSIKLWQDMVYCASEAGTLKAFSAASGQQIRAANVGSPLTSIVLLEAETGQDKGLGTIRHPLLLAGSFDNNVYAYSVEFGRISGSFQAHDDTVSCLQLQDNQLYSGSCDGSVKAWSLGEGREPWQQTGAFPAAEFETDSSVTSISCWDSSLVLAGLQDGSVSALDSRTQTAVWQTEVSSRNVTDVCQVPGGNHALVSASDGTLSLLDVRQSGLRLSQVKLSPPLNCCQSDGVTAIAGGKGGQVHFWDIGQQLGRPPESNPPPAPNGLYQSLSTVQSSISSLCLSTSSTSSSLLVGTDDGIIGVIPAH